MMTALARPRARSARPSTADAFTPKLVSVLREGYGLQQLRADAVAGLTVAIVALPLSMAIAIGSGLSPDKGLYTAIVGGFVISALGGSRHQIGGPAGAFIVLVATIVERHGYDGLVLATAMAGAMMIGVGLLKLGTVIKFIPFPVTVGFTAGIATIIFVAQLRELLGLDMAKEPAALLPKLWAIGHALATAKPVAMAVALLTIVIIVALRRWRPAWPGFLIAIAIGAAITALVGLDVATIGTRFGGVPRALPLPSLPAFDLGKIQAVLPDAVAIALLGSIESLLSAVVADGMTGRQHRSNMELVAQGTANIAAVAFGGLCVTGTIARTATNVRAGAHGPVSGLLHAVYLLLFMIVAAPLAGYIPLASLGGVLAVVAWNMADKEEFVGLVRTSRGDATVVLATFLLTILADLTIAIAVGVALGALVLLVRMAEAVEVDSGDRLAGAAEAAGNGANEAPIEQDRDIVVYRLSGAFFFGSAAAIGAILDRIGASPRLVVLDCSAAPVIDSTAARSLERFARKIDAGGGRLYVTGARRLVRRTLLASGLRRPLVRYAPSVDDAITQWRTGHEQNAA